MHDHTHVENPNPQDPRTLINVDLFGSANYLEEHDKGYKCPPHNSPSADTSFGLIPSIEPVKIPGKLHSADALPSCHSGFVMGTCTNGHHFAKAILCGKEYCVDCGENWSWIHQRRHYRWLPKVKSMQSVGYMVVTLPLEVRKFFMDKKRLNVFRRYCIRLLKREGYDRGVCRWHWCGEDGVTWHPHLNFLFPEEYISKEKLREIRNKITARLVSMSRIHVHTTVIHYSYSNQGWKKRHWCKYVTRSTWRKFTEPLGQVIKGYRNNVIWGDWKAKKDDNSVAKLERGCCPLCNEPIKWSSVQGDINFDDWTQINAGYYLWNYKELPP